MIGRYNHIFFDLDQTLWDYKANAREALAEIFHMLSLQLFVADFESFYKRFIALNDILWVDYRHGKIHKEQLRDGRFRMLLSDFGCHQEALVLKISSLYLEITPQKGALIPGAREALGQLYGKARLYILTNGFPETQYLKVKSGGLEGLFEKIITSYDAGWQKPDRRAFSYALKTNNAKKQESIMIGDDPETDIQGAVNFGLDCIYYNPALKKENSLQVNQIGHLSELYPLLFNMHKLKMAPR